MMEAAEAKKSAARQEAPTMPRPYGHEYKSSGANSLAVVQKLELKKMEPPKFL